MTAFFKHLAASALLAASLTAHLPAHARHDASDASELSMVPVVLSVTAPALVLSAGATLSVVSVEASAEGTVWVLARASDGARTSVVVASKAAGGLSVAAGTAIEVSVFSAGWVLSAAGKAVAFIPNELGRSLMHNERISR